MASVVFIDSRVEDTEALIAGLADDVQVVILNPAEDGVTQIATALAGVTNLDAIHIESHGSEGTLYIGSTVLSAENLDEYQAELLAIGAALSETGDLLLYGCAAGAGEAGEGFIASLARYTGADVAASDDATGAPALGGDWILEARSGNVESAPVVAAAAQETYAFTLGGISDANTWWTAPAGGTPMSGYAADTDFADWFHLGALTPGLPARVSILPDYFVPYASGVPLGGLLPATLITGGNIQLNQRVTITGNFVEGAIAEGLHGYLASTEHGNQLLVPVGGAIELTDQILTQQYGAGTLPYVFYQVTAIVPSVRTVVYNDPVQPANSYTVMWENEFYLDVGLSGEFPNAPPATAGRYLVTTGNPTGQRSAEWGAWIDGWDIVTLAPVGSPSLPGSGNLDPEDLPSTIEFYGTADGHGVETPAIADSVDAAWWRSFGETVLLGYSALAFDALKQVAGAWGRPNLGAAIDVVNASAGAAGVWSFLDALAAKMLAHAAEGMTLAALASGSPNPAAYSSQIANWETRGGQIAQEAEQQAQDQSLSIVLDKLVAGAGTVWSVFRSIPYGSHEKNSFSLGLQVPQLLIEGTDQSDVMLGGSGADKMSLGGGLDFALGFEGNDTIAAGAGRDWLQGGSGRDHLTGDAGVDTLRGGTGNDTYVVGAGDVVTERSGQGTDLVRSSGSYTLGSDVENLTLTGRAGVAGAGNSAANTITGNNAGNTLSGNGGGDTLRGLGGADFLRGGTGKDTLTGGAGADKFDFNTALGAANVDRITDFNAAADTIRLDNDFFTAFGTVNVTLAAGAFHKGAGVTAAHDGSDRIVYNTTNGNVYYDADGQGGAAATLFATLAGAPAITNADFFIIG